MAARKKTKLERSMERTVRKPSVRARIAAALTPTRRKRKMSPMQALARAGALLSKAQGVLGSYVLNVEAREENPWAYSRGNDLYNDIESARRRLGRPRGRK
jgi:hypothetical protein